MICGGDGSFTGLDTKCTVVQCSVPEIPNATVEEGTTFGGHRDVQCEVEYTVTGLCGDELQTMECMETERFCSWKQCKQGSCCVPPRVVSADIQICVDCEVHCRGSLPCTCITNHSVDPSPNGSNAFTTNCESTGLFRVVLNCTIIVCDALPQSWKNGTFGDGAQDTAVSGPLPSCVGDDEASRSEFAVVLVEAVGPDAVSEGRVVVPSHMVLESDEWGPQQHSSGPSFSRRPPSSSPSSPIRHCIVTH